MGFAENERIYTDILKESVYCFYFVWALLLLLSLVLLDWNQFEKPKILVYKGITSALLDGSGVGGGGWAWGEYVVSVASQLALVHVA